MSFEKRERRGATFLVTSCRSLLVSALLRLKSTAVISSSLFPDLSSAAIVFSKSGGSGFSDIALISSEADLIDSSTAGLKLSV